MFQKKPYPEIVEQIIEHLTKGAVGEKYDYEPDQVRYKLGNSPVREIVRVQGLLRGAQHTFAQGKDYRQAGDLLEWLSAGERPDSATSFFVSYSFGTPSGITDANPGSVVRTIIEAIAREIDLLYEEMDHVYDSGFIDTATGRALEMVVSLLGLERTPPQKSTGLVTFGRATPPEEIAVTGEVHLFDGRLACELKTQPVSHIKELKGSSRGTNVGFDEEKDFVLEQNTIRWLLEGRLPDPNSSFTVSYVAFQKITVPAGTTVTTLSPDPRKLRTFVTKDERTLTRQPDGKWEADVRVEAGAPGKEGNVPAGTIQVMPRPPLGVEYVVNKQDIITGVDAENEDQLRLRAKKALEAAGKATLLSIESAIRRIEGVRSILIQDRPDNVPGIIRVVVDGGETESVQRAIDETRSAGIYVELRRPKIASIDVNITAAVRRGVSQSQAQAGIEERVRSYLSRLEIGVDIVYSRLLAHVMESADIHDIQDLTLVVQREGEPVKTTSGENILMSPDERAQVRNVNVSVRPRQ